MKSMLEFINIRYLDGSHIYFTFYFGKIVYFLHSLLELRLYLQVWEQLINFVQALWNHYLFYAIIQAVEKSDYNFLQIIVILIVGEFITMAFNSYTPIWTWFGIVTIFSSSTPITNSMV